ncbi:MAG: hypothetical protein II956_12170 [Bacteroidales bacterium]|nr:hypothetical protein [Bacteroidales bacterium]
MKHFLLTLSAAAICSAVSAQETQTVCPGAVKNYHIENPTANSDYVWSLFPEDAGIIIPDTETHGRISVEWKKEGTLSVHEETTEGCKSETSFVKVKFLTPPSAEFDNAEICFTENLQFVFPKNSVPPIKVTYTINGEEKTVEDIKTEKYTVEKNAGKYRIIKVTDGNGCEGVPQENNTAEIAPELKTLTITKD